MKKLFLILFATALTVTGYSQMQLGVRGGVGMSFAGGTVGTSPLAGLSFQNALGDNMSLGGNVDFVLATGNTTINIQPSFDYYFNEVFDGFHVGLAAGVGIQTMTGAGIAIPIDANIGYNIAAGDNFRIDIFAMPGITLANSTATFGVKPGVCLGYKF